MRMHRSITYINLYIVTKREEDGMSGIIRRLDSIERNMLRIMSEPQAFGAAPQSWKQTSIVSIEEK